MPILTQTLYSVVKMYSYLTGLLKVATPEQVVLDLAGVGYRIGIPLSLFAKLPSIGSSITLHVSFVVREFSHALWGFKEPEERDLFEQLIDLSGVGPKLAISILGHLDPADFYKTIFNADIDGLARVPGIGKKKAEKLILEMKGKVPEHYPTANQFVVPLSGQAALLSDATRALVHLGYVHPVANRAVQKGLQLLPESAPLSAVITEALKHV